MKTPALIAWEIAKRTRLQVKPYEHGDFSIGYSWKGSQGREQWKPYLTFTEEHALDLIAQDSVECFVERSVRAINQMMAEVGNAMVSEFLAEEQKQE